MSTYTVLGYMTDCDPTPQEIKECGTKEEAVTYMRNLELTAHPDIYFWAESSNNNTVIDSCTRILGDTY